MSYHILYTDREFSIEHYYHDNLLNISSHILVYIISNMHDNLLNVSSCIFISQLIFM